MYSDLFCRIYDEYGWNYYPEAFAGKVLIWIRKNGLKIRNTLDLACGTGIFSDILSQHGIEADGMDLSADMIRIARERRPDLRFDVADMITYDPGRTYDLVTCNGDALNHILDSADVDRIFANIYGYLNPGGFLIFNVLRNDKKPDEEPFDFDMEDGRKVTFQILQDAEGVINFHIRVVKPGQEPFEEVIREVFHDPDMLCSLLRKNGFSLLRRSGQLLEEDEDGREPTCIIVARKS